MGVISVNHEDKEILSIANSVKQKLANFLANIKNDMELREFYQYFIKQIRYYSTYKEKTYIYDYIEIYANAPRNSWNSELRKRINIKKMTKKDEYMIKILELETILSEIQGTYRKLDTLLDLLNEKLEEIQK